jgi:amino acid adenylation domain-containing protein
MNTSQKYTNIYNLTPMQEGLLFHHLAGNDYYNVQIRLTLSGIVEVETLRKSAQILVDRHDALRISVIHHNLKKPRQAIMKERSVDFIFHDFSGEENIEKLTREAMDFEWKKTFDLAKGPLSRFTLIKKSSDAFVLLMTVHHIIMDGWCLDILITELFECYRQLKEYGQTSLPPAHTFEEYLDWFGRQDTKRHLDYWSDYLQGYENKHCLECIQDASGVSKPYVLREHVIGIDEKQTAAFNRLAEKNDVTIGNLFQALWGLLVSRYANSDDIIYGNVVSGRAIDLEHAESMVGLFINTLPQRIRIEPNGNLLDLARSIRSDFTESALHGLASLAEIEKLASIGGSVVDHLFVMENYPFEANDRSNRIFDSCGLMLESIEGRDQTSYNLNIIVFPGSKCSIKFSYNRNVYPDTQIARIGDDFLRLVSLAIDTPARKTCDYDFLSNAERVRLIPPMCQSVDDYPRKKTLIHFFEENVQRYPDAAALYCGNSKLSYNDFNRRSNRLARELQNEGIGRGALIGILTERSFDMLIAVYAVLKTGAAYIPIDPNYPPDRIKYILEDSGTRIVLTQKKYMNTPNIQVRMIALDDQQNIAGEDTNLGVETNADDLAYVIYTSGSTGKPKGVMISHRVLVNSLFYMEKYFSLDKDSVYLFKTTYTFDVSTAEIFSIAFGAGAIAILPPNAEKNPSEITGHIFQHRITHVNFVPSMLNAYLESLGQGEVEKLSSLKYIFVAGEAFGDALLRKIRASGIQALAVNIYGPSETFYTTRYIVKENDSSVPIGSSWENLRLYILGKNNELLPFGATGELCVSGDGLADGYLNQPDLSHERFVPDPFYPGETMYRTGDLVSWRKDGNLNYVGRADNQVKIRGFRIELDEVEKNIALQPGVIDCAVTVFENHGDKELCGYLVLTAETTAEKVRSGILEKLAAYMIPTVFVVLERMPMTANGKIDRKALPAPDNNQSVREFREPRNETEKILTEIWKEILGVERIGIDDDFFSLGGHSIKAISVVSRISKLLNVSISVMDVFEAPTVVMLNERLKLKEKERFQKLYKADNREYYPLSSQQLRLYALQQLEKDGIAYNMPVAFDVTGVLDIQRLKRALEAVIRNHDSLRTEFILIEDEPKQIIKNQVCFELEVEEVDIGEASMKLKSFVRPFDLARAPLFRVKLFKTGSHQQLLVFDMHHIISDGVSMEVVLRDLEAAFRGDSFTENEFQYKDYSVWQREGTGREIIKREEEFWLEKFQGEIPHIDFPLDFKRSAIRKSEGDWIGGHIGLELAATIKKYCSDHKVTEYMFLMAAFQILLSKYSGAEDIIVGSPVNGRSHADFEKICGMFVNMLAIRSNPSPQKTFVQYLEEIKDNCLGCFANQNYPFEELVKKVLVHRDTSRLPVFDMMFSFQKFEIEKLTLDGLVVKPRRPDITLLKYDIEYIIADEEGMPYQFAFNSSLFSKSSMEKFLERYQLLLARVAKTPNMKIGAIEITSDEERRLILETFSGIKMDYPRNKTLVELFEERVRQTPEKTAVVDGSKQKNFRELNDMANTIAFYLQQKGIQRESRVGLMMGKCIEMVAGTLGIVKAGGIYIPINPNYPRERINYMLSDCQATLVLTQADLFSRLPPGVEGVDLNEIVTLKNESRPITPGNQANDLAYIMYTSGSTGGPKGVMVTHRNIVRLVCNTNFINFKPEDRILQTGAIVFDATTLELWGSLIHGPELHLCEDDIILDHRRLKNYLESNKITFMWLTAPLFHQFAQVQPGMFKSLKYLFVGGDVLSCPQINAVRNQCPMLTIVNGYGPTENTTFTTTFVISHNYSDNIPIGKPIANTSAYILDKSGCCVPIGVPGELYTGGDGVARGYLNQAELTAGKFIPNPFAKGDILYRTGDRVRWLPDGNIEFQGRFDNQVKIRGFRIELGEIENVLKKLEGVKDALVVVRDANDIKTLHAYLVLENPISVDRIKNKLRESLPDYMIPARFIPLEKFPLNANGKIDKAALPLPKERGSSSGKMHIGRIEEAIIRVWEDVLGIEEIDRNDDFFELGGDSLNAIKVTSKLQKEGISVTIGELMRYSKLMEFKLNINGKTEDRNGMPVFNDSGSDNHILSTALPAGDFGSYIVMTLNAVVTEAEYKTLVEKMASILTPQSLPHYLITHGSSENRFSHGMFHLTDNELAVFKESLMAELDKKTLHFEEQALLKQKRSRFPFSAMQSVNLQLKNMRASVCYIPVKNCLDESLLRETIIALIRREELFRSVAVRENDQYYWQEYDFNENVDFPFVDLSCLTPEKKNIFLNEIVTKFVKKEYGDLEVLPYNIVIIKENLKDYIILFPMDHVIFDGTSLNIIQSDILYHIKNRKFMTENDRLTFSDYVNQIRKGPQSISEEKIIELFELEKFRKASQVMARTVPEPDSVKVHTLKIPIEDRNRDQNESDMLDLALNIFCLACKDIMNLDLIPLMFVNYGRLYQGKNYFSTIGEFVDLVPYVADFTGQPCTKHYPKINLLTNTLINHNINFMHLLHGNDGVTAQNSIKNILTSDNMGYEQNVIRFNFVGKFDDDVLNNTKNFDIKNMVDVNQFKGTSCGVCYDSSHIYLNICAQTSQSQECFESTVERIKNLIMTVPN